MLKVVSKRAAAIFALIALAFSVIVPLSIPKAFSAPDNGCHKVEVKDYSEKIAQAVEKIGKSWDGKDYSWDWKILPDIVPGLEKELEFTSEELHKVFGEKAMGFLHGPPTVGPEAQKERTEPKWVKHIRTEIGDATKYDRAVMTKIITGKVADFLDENPRENCENGSDAKTGCKKAEVKDYAEGIKKVVDEIEASKHKKEVTGKVESEHGASSFLKAFYVHEWNTAILRQVNPAITERLALDEEQTKQVFGDGAKPELTAKGAPPAMDEHGNTIYAGEGSETFHAEKATKFDREAMTKIVTDRVAEFLAKNPQEICEGGNDTKPSKDEPTTEPTKPGASEPTTEPTKPGSDTEPCDNAKPSDTHKPGSSSATDGGDKPTGGAATASNGQTVLEGATEDGGLATTGAVGLIALGLSAVLIGAGAVLAVYHRKTASKNV